MADEGVYVAQEFRPCEGNDTVGKDLVSLEVRMPGRQTMMVWGDPRLLLRQLQVFPTATINGISGAPFSTTAAMAIDARGVIGRY